VLVQQLQLKLAVEEEQQQLVEYKNIVLYETDN
jgi:hypothetical protein